MRGQGLFNLAKQRLKGALVTVCKYIRRLKTMVEDELFKLTDYTGTRANYYKLFMNTFRLKMRQWFLTTRRGRF